MRIRHAKPEIAQADMTPMIDMTFQLIAFFMIVSNFEQLQADERVKLPADEMAVPPDSPRQDDIVVNVGFIRNEDGTKADEEPYIFSAGGPIRILESEPYFRRERDRQVAVHGEPSLSEVTIVIRADRSVPTGLIQEMMRIAQEVGGGGFTRFSLKAEKGEEEPRL